MNCKTCLTIFNSIQHNHIDCFKYFYNPSLNLNIDIICSIVEYNNVELLDFVLKNGAEFNDYITNICCIKDNLECLKYSVENGCKKNKWSLIFAIVELSNRCLKYCIESEFPYDEKLLSIITNNWENVNTNYPNFCNKQEYDWRKCYSNCLIRIELYKIDSLNKINKS